MRTKAKTTWWWMRSVQGLRGWGWAVLPAPLLAEGVMPPHPCSADVPPLQDPSSPHSVHSYSSRENGLEKLPLGRKEPAPLSPTSMASSSSASPSRSKDAPTVPAPPPRAPVPLRVPLDAPLGVPLGIGPIGHHVGHPIAHWSHWVSHRALVLLGVPWSTDPTGCLGGHQSCCPTPIE